jgi:hypothetical protein
MQKDPTELDWQDTDMPESSDPTDPLLVILSTMASVKSSRELLMAERRSTTPLALTAADEEF